MSPATGLLLAVVAPRSLSVPPSGSIRTTTTAATATAPSSPREAADGAELIVTMLSDADAVVAAVDGEDGALAGAGDGAIWVQTSTIGIEGMERCADLAERRGVVLVDAPVLGTKAP